MSVSVCSKCCKGLIRSVIPRVFPKESLVSAGSSQASVWPGAHEVVFYGLHRSEHAKKAFVFEKLGGVLIE